MRKPTVACALLAAMIAKHRWGSPIDRDALLRVAAVPRSDYPRARTAFEELRTRRFITNRGKRGIELDSSHFGDLAEFLFRECGWDPTDIRTRLKHYEGWSNHDWA